MKELLKAKARPLLIIRKMTPASEALPVHRCFHHLQERLSPLVSVTTGKVHPWVPRTLLAYHLLIVYQLDELARHYHQVLPSVVATTYYQITIDPWIGSPDQGNISIETRRERFGKFIGLSKDIMQNRPFDGDTKADVAN